MSPRSDDPGAVPERIEQRGRDLLTAICTLSSASDDVAGLDAVARRLADAFAESGWVAEVERVTAESDELPLLVVRRDVSTEARILAVGHLDTVLPAMAPRVEGDRFLATGGVDMKGGLAAFWAALEWLRERQIEPPPFELVVVPDEEAEGVITRRVMRERGRRASEIWVLEPGTPQADGAESVVAARYGLVTWRLQARGRSAHAGIDFRAGRSALVAAADWCAAAAVLARPNGGPIVNVGRLVGGDSDLVDGGAIDLLGTARRLNVVAERALAEGELRAPNDVLAAETEALLTDLAVAKGRQHQVALELEVVERVPALAPSERQLQAADRAVALAGSRGWRLIVEGDRGGISFPNYLPADLLVAGSVTVLDGLGPVGGGMHTREEFVSLVSLRRRIALLADLLTEA